MSQNAPNRPLFELQAYHRRAIELRYEGQTYKEICGHLGVEFKIGKHPDTIKRWFGKDGLLAQHYADYAKDENDHRRQVMRTELKKLVGKVPIVLQGLIERTDKTGQPDAVALMAIRTLTEILGITADDEKETQDVLEQYMRRLPQVRKEREKQREQGAVS